MKAVERKLNKAQLVTIWLLIISLVLATAYITLILVARKLASSNSGSTGSNIPEIIGFVFPIIGLIVSIIGLFDNGGKKDDNAE